MNHRTKITQLLVVCLPLLALVYTCALRPLNATGLAAPEGSQTRNPATPPGAKSQSAPAYGIYPALVTSGPDPHLRVQVEIPAVGNSREWALPCLPVGSTATPPLGSQVWVMFEGGDTHMPVWMGLQPRS